MPASPNSKGEKQGDGTLLVHATSIVYAKRALIITGPSGSGKSALALHLMALGAGLIADDQTRITATPDGPPMASCPPALRGLIEARGLGILTTNPARPAPVAAIVDLSQTEAARLPPERTRDLLGWPIPLFHKAATDHFAPALLLYLKGGRSSG
ncbi:MAG: HPr kinase/phosphatase C-terminal domain-containing protein [Pseudomonadota bacterium]